MGAVAYLQHNAYGSATNVRVNNNVAFVTGYSSLNEATCEYTGTNEDCNRIEEILPGNNGSYTYMYNTETGYLASTTGNISGIYDMSGGAWEYVMNFMLNSTGTLIVGNLDTQTSGFKGLISSTEEVVDGLEIPDKKYYDIYQLSTTANVDFYNRILGDATGEMGPFSVAKEPRIHSWYKNKSDFLGIYTYYVMASFLRG